MVFYIQGMRGDMKEIKFRVWNPRYKSFNFWGFERGEEIFTGIPTGAGLTIAECSENSQQFTGLEDINKKEIYEGDILQWIEKRRWDNIDKKWVDEQKIIGIVRYEDLTASTHLISLGGTSEALWRKKTSGEIYDMVIIGNIYENPELLK